MQRAALRICMYYCNTNMIIIFINFISDISLYGFYRDVRYFVVIFRIYFALYTTIIRHSFYGNTILIIYFNRPISKKQRRFPMYFGLVTVIISLYIICNILLDKWKARRSSIVDKTVRIKIYDANAPKSNCYEYEIMLMWN